MTRHRSSASKTNTNANSKAKVASAEMAKKWEPVQPTPYVPAQNVIRKSNPKYIDLLDEDTTNVIPSQQWECISFVDPGQILKKREHYFFEQFLKNWDLTKSMTVFQDFLRFVSFTYGIEPDPLIKHFENFVQEERDKIRATNVTAEYNDFVDKNETRLMDEYNDEHGFQTSVFGMKLRGAYSTYEEARFHARAIREQDPYHDVHVCQRFAWIPVCPSAHKTGQIEYLEEELNQLVQEKIKNEAAAKQEFDKRVMDAKRKAVEENVAKAKKTGATVSQTVNEAGHLVGISTQEKLFRSDSPVQTSDLESVLFDHPIIPTASASASTSTSTSDK